MTQPTLADWQARAAALTLEGRAFINGQYVSAASGRVFATRNPATGKVMPPQGLDGPMVEIGEDEDPRQKLVDWMAAPENPFFAKVIVNRVWADLMGRGLVDPVMGGAKAQYILASALEIATFDDAGSLTRNCLAP